MLANLTRRVVEIERTQGAGAAERHLNQMAVLLRLSSGSKT